MDSKMESKTLAIIMAAGYGTRMGDIGVPKTMLPDGKDRHFIDDALTFLKYAGVTLDFAVMSRNEEFFAGQNTYLQEHCNSGKFDVLYQKTGPADHVIAYIKECFMNRAFRESIKKYDRVVLLPGDHKLTSSELNLVDLIEAHKRRQADVSSVYASGTAGSSAVKELIRVDNEGMMEYVADGRVSDVSSIHPKEGAIEVTGTGVWVLNNSFITVLKVVTSYLYNKCTHGKIPSVMRWHPYLIDQWSGGRDTPQSIGK
ncbi:hypothetical protein CMO93_06310 [Candidatus Woesearchaeota archaeon]|mgnify:CR=1 FL=1|nr:hypothetical protein [Candidatus Woesearchaeota archaeon]|tara:strand:- start:1447 stop:2217 length:771 start_codon:yes stop_codon:yes gene_type:complete